MRQKRTAQISIYDGFADHELGRELRAMSEWLDQHCELLDGVMDDLHRGACQDTGRDALSAESALRCALLKQHRQLSYEELAFHLQDSASVRAFADALVSEEVGVAERGCGDPPAYLGAHQWSAQRQCSTASFRARSTNSDRRHGHR